MKLFRLSNYFTKKELRPSKTGKATSTAGAEFTQPKLTTLDLADTHYSIIHVMYVKNLANWKTANDFPINGR